MKDEEFSEKLMEEERKRLEEEEKRLKEERENIRNFLVEYIFSKRDGVYYSCNTGSIFEEAKKRGHQPLLVSGCLLELEGKLIEKDLIEYPFLKKTETGAKSRFYKPKVSLEKAREILELES